MVRFVRGVTRRRVFDSLFDGFFVVLEGCDFARRQRARRGKARIRPRQRRKRRRLSQDPRP